MISIRRLDPLYPIYLTLLVFLPTRNVAFALSLALLLSWIVGIALSGIGMVIALAIILVISAVAFQDRYRTPSFGARCGGNRNHRSLFCRYRLRCTLPVLRNISHIEEVER